MSLLPKDFVLLLAGLVLLSLVFWVASPVPGTWNLFPLAALLYLLPSALILFCYRKLNRRLQTMDEQAATARRVEYRQIESLIQTLALLRPRRSLPSMRGMAISPDFASLLVDTLQTLRPRTIVELGCGVSTIVSSYVMEGMPGEAKLVSIDHDSTFSNICRAQLQQHGFSNKTQIYDCPLVRHTLSDQQWQFYDLSRAELPDQIDLLVIDGPPEWIQPMSRYPAVPLLFSRLSPHATILLDDAGRPDERKAVERWLGEFAGLQHRFVELEKGASVITRGA